jgi:hypothetical protein
MGRRSLTIAPKYSVVIAATAMCSCAPSVLSVTNRRPRAATHP